MPVGPSPAPHRRVRWHKPANGKRRPGVLDATRVELVRSLEQQHGSLWLRICRIVIVAGYPLSRALHRVRRLRSDGTESLLAMAVALLYLADIRTGFIGRPRAGGGPWHRYTLADLAQRAYGAQTPADIKRAQRAIDMMVNLRWAFPSRQVRRYSKEKDGFCSEPGVRRLNLDQLCKMTGTGWLLKRDRQHADAKKGVDVDAIGGARKRRQERQEGKVGHGSGNPARRDRTRSTGDPPGPRAIADLLNAI